MTLKTERDKIAHLLRRFGLGASEAEIDFYGKDGLKGAINTLLDYPNQTWEWNLDPAEFANRQGTVNLRVMQQIWYLRLAVTQKPLEEKLTLFWHSHFATSAQKVENSYVMQNHIETLRSHALGRFEDLLVAVSQDPAMIYWLDNQENVKGKPNENYAREVMELFTLGIGHYTEEDIQEAARAFTGWGYGIRGRAHTNAPRRPDRFVFSADRHDEGVKTVLGKTGNWNGTDVARILCEHAETSRFIARKMWEFFAYSKPDAALVERLAKAYRDSDLRTSALVRAMMEAPEFYSDRCARKQVKHPIDFAISTLRQLGVGAAQWTRIQQAIASPERNPDNGLNQPLLRSMAPSAASWQTTKSQGMELLLPPDVSGWHPGFDWITSATMLERVKWAERLFMGSTAPQGEPANIGGTQGTRVPAVGYNPWSLFAENPTPQYAVSTLMSIFDATLPADKVKVLVEAASATSGGRITVRNAGDTARSIAKLIFGSPEFQFC